MSDSLLDKDDTKISLGLNVKIISNATTKPTGPTGILKFVSVLGRSLVLCVSTIFVVDY